MRLGTGQQTGRGQTPNMVLGSVPRSLDYLKAEAQKRFPQVGDVVRFQFQKDHSAG